MKKVISALLCIAFVFSTVCFPGFSAFAAESAKSVKGEINYEKAFDVVSIVNKERKKQKLPPLTMNKTLLDCAMTRAAECAVKFDHERPNGKLCFSVFPEGFSYFSAGENIAYGYNMCMNAKSVMESWMDSPGHRANILTQSYNCIGVGCFISGNSYYWVQMFSESETVDQAKLTDEAVQVSYSVSLNTKKNTLCTAYKPGHKYKTKVVKPTYTSGGYTLHTCTVCHKSYKDKKTKKLVLKNTSLNVSSGKKAFTAKWKKISAATGYQIQYATDKSFKKNRKTVTVSKNKTTSKKISKLKAKKKYYVRIRTYKSVKVNGKNTKVYSGWSKAKTVKTK